MSFEFVTANDDYVKIVTIVVLVGECVCENRFNSVGNCKSIKSKRMSSDDYHKKNSLFICSISIKQDARGNKSHFVAC
jgi:hypothetical protein